MVKERKRQEKLKRRLLKKQINKILYRIKKGFVKGYEAVEGIYIEGGLKELKELCKKFGSLEGLYKKVKKFVDK
jgi:hypothetical protein